jgi:hypothetical protein
MANINEVHHHRSLKNQQFSLKLQTERIGHYRLVEPVVRDPVLKGINMINLIYSRRCIRAFVTPL